MSHLEPDGEDGAYEALLRKHQELQAKVERLEERLSDALEVAEIGWDWKNSPDLDELRESLAPFGLYVYDDPAWEGTDYTSYLISNRELTSKELQAYEIRYAEEEEEEEDD